MNKSILGAALAAVVLAVVMGCAGTNGNGIVQNKPNNGVGTVSSGSDKGNNISDVNIPANAPSVTTFTDSRDGKTYKKVVIGGQTWMAENLNYPMESSVCYENKTEYCATYGRLYNWSTAMEACPAGWHLPTDDEWKTLVKYAGGENTAGKKLKSTSDWIDNGNGTDEYLFSALPGGGGNSGGYFDAAGYYGYWWSSTEGGAWSAWARLIFCSYENVGRYNGGKGALNSVRCVQD